MSQTPLSLLDRLRLRPDEAAWRQLLDLYVPFLRLWLRRHGAPPDDVEDLVQDALAVVVRELPRFEHNGRPGAFRAWLRQVAAHRLGALWRSRPSRPVAVGGDAFAAALARLEDPASELSRQWDREHDLHVAHQLQEMARGDFEPATWQAFRRVVLDGARAADAAAELGVSVNAVLLARSRVLRRLREMARGLVGG
jgi:RNA polymerase sigma-70 factor (ECF subfamily)